MPEIIRKIELFSGKEDYSEHEGYAITTDLQVIKLYITNDQHCCENWGYFMTPDDTSDFIGAELVSVAVVDDSLETKELFSRIAESPEDSDYLGDTMFVNIETNKGTLQFTAYNEHNGYYCHKATVACTQLKASKRL